MSKYNTYDNNDGIVLEDILVLNENILWRGKPKKSAFIINRVLFMLPIVILWLLLDSSFIISLFNDFNRLGNSLILFITFFVIHLFPVWVWFYNVVSAGRVWDNTEYCITDKRIITKTGFIGMNYQSLFYKEIRNVTLKVGIIDKILNVGDIHFALVSNCNNYHGNNNVNTINSGFIDIEDAYKVYPMIQKIVLDIQTDMEYPNDFRPKDNHGYNTIYENREKENLTK